MTHRVLTLVAVVVLAGAGLFSSAAHCDAVVLMTRSDGVSVRFSAELALTPTARQTGLMYRRTLPPRSGMWFDFERVARIVMWMKNTLLPLDMLFITAAGEVAGITSHTEPLSEVRVVAPEAVRYVFEINAGEAARYGITRGTRAQLLR